MIQISAHTKKYLLLFILVLTHHHTAASTLDTLPKSIDPQKANVIEQRLDAACGLAALATALRYQFNQDVTEESLLLELVTLPIDEKRLVEGLTLRDIAQLANNHHLNAVWKKISIDDLQVLSKKNLLIIRFMINNFTPHYSVLKKNGVDQDLIYLADPAFGNITIKKNDLIKRWYLPNQKTGYALILEPIKKDAIPLNLLDKSAEQGISYIDINTAQLRSILFPPENKWIARLSLETTALKENSYNTIPGLTFSQSGYLYTASFDLSYGLEKHSSLNIFGSWSRSTTNHSLSYADIYGNSVSSSASNSNDKLVNLGIGLSRVVYEETHDFPQFSISGNAILPSSDVIHGYSFSGSLKKSIGSNLILFSNISANRYLMSKDNSSIDQSSLASSTYSAGGYIELLQKWGTWGELMVGRLLTWSPSITKNSFYRTGIVIPITRLTSAEPYYSFIPNKSRTIGVSISTSF